jgi:hypothetical protein
MGKRELLIAIVFAALAAVVYQVTSTPSANGQGFTFARFWNQLHRSMPDRASATAASTLSTPVPAGISGVRIAEIAGGVTIEGEDRDDIAAEFTVRASATDDALAAACAKFAHLKVDTVASILAFGPVYQRECRSVGTLTLKVPRRLTARIEGGNGLHVSDISALRVVGASGGAVLAGISAGITGDLRAGSVQISDAGPIDLTLNGTQSTITNVRGTLRLDLRTGRCVVTGVTGGAEIEERQSDLDLHDTKGLVRVGGTGGRLRVFAPQSEVRVDVHRATVSAEMSKAVPLSLSTTDGTIDVRLSDGLAVDLDAAAIDGNIVAGDWQLTATRSDHDAHLAHTWGTAAVISLRTSRGDITIKKLDR